VFAVALVLEPLTLALAKELGPDIAEHCFTRQGGVRDEMTRVQVRLREKPQQVIARMASDATASATLRHVRVPSITITKRGADKDEKLPNRKKKIAPQAVTLRATISCLVDPAEKVQREFLCRFINDWMLFTFDPEERDLFAEIRAEQTNDDDDGDDELPELEMTAPPPDEEAGDVLDEQRARGRGGKKRAPRLVKAKKRANGRGAAAGA
jgi:hypothetical protein